MRGDAGRIIKHCRESRQMTQKDLSKASGIARVTIASYESGHSEPAFDKFQALLDTMGFEAVIRRKEPREIRRMRGKEILRQ